MIIKGIGPELVALAAEVGVLSSLRHENHLITDLSSAIAHGRSHVRRAAADRQAM